MKLRISITLFAILFAVPASTQDQAGKIIRVPFERGVYYDGPTGLVALPTRLFMPLQDSRWRDLLGLGISTRLRAVVPGGYAALAIPDRRPTFYLRGDRLGNQTYLVRGAQKGDRREFLFNRDSQVGRVGGISRCGSHRTRSRVRGWRSDPLATSRRSDTGRVCFRGGAGTPLSHDPPGVRLRRAARHSVSRPRPATYNGRSMEATVLVPTHDHADTLLYSVASAQAQTVQDLEILVVGDGVPDRTREVMETIQRRDSRIRFFDFPKDPGRGETHRNQVLSGARGRVVCYLCDDDLWLRTHIEHVSEALQDADFANTLELVFPPGGEPAAMNGFDFGDPADREKMISSNFGFGLSSGAHTLEAYRRLPHGWRKSPEPVHTDVFMWREIAQQSWCRAVSVPFPTVLKFASAYRMEWTTGQRLTELAEWSQRIAAAGFGEWLAAHALKTVWRQSTEARTSTPWIRMPFATRPVDYRLGERIGLASGANGTHYLSWGWGEAEAWGRWTDGPEARLLLRLDQEPWRTWRWMHRAQDSWGRTVSHRGGRGSERPPRRDLEVGRTQLVTRRVTIPRPPRTIDLRFQIPGIVRAARRAETNDQRRIGLGVAWLELAGV